MLWKMRALDEGGSRIAIVFKGSPLFAGDAGSGGNFHLTLGARVSQRFARAVVTSTLEGRTSFTESLRLLGFRKMVTFNQLAGHLGIGA